MRSESGTPLLVYRLAMLITRLRQGEGAEQLSEHSTHSTPGT